MEKLKVFYGTPEKVEKDYNEWAKDKANYPATTQVLLGHLHFFLVVWYKEKEKVK